MLEERAEEEVEAGASNCQQVQPEPHIQDRFHFFFFS